MLRSEAILALACLGYAHESQQVAPSVLKAGQEPYTQTAGIVSLNLDDPSKGASCRMTHGRSHFRPAGELKIACGVHREVGCCGRVAIGG